MIGKRFRSLPFIFANDNYTLRSPASGKAVFSQIKRTLKEISQAPADTSFLFLILLIFILYFLFCFIRLAFLCKNNRSSIRRLFKIIQTNRPAQAN